MGHSEWLAVKFSKLFCILLNEVREEPVEIIHNTQHGDSMTTQMKIHSNPKKSFNKWLCGLALLFTTACVGDVRPGPDGIHSVIMLTDDRDDGARAALRQAKRWCKKDKQDFAIHDEMITFICDMDEADYLRAKQLAAAAQAAGAVTSGTSEEESNAETVGDILQAGGAAAEAALGDCYEVELIFECIQ